MKRRVQPELLDELPPDDPRAIHSRRDLQRLNAIMANARSLLNYLAGADLKSSCSLTEIGAGDGTITTQITKSLAQNQIGGHALLVDRQPTHAIQTQAGWTLESITADIFDYFKTAAPCDVIIASLFLHHFEDDRLRELLAAVESHCRVFAAVEPRRSALAEFAARRVGWIGCNAVTQNDAVISVRAGFTDSDLSRLWPNASAWKITERRAGLFSHFFGATRA
jgi:hypothetical protein